MTPVGSIPHADTLGERPYAGELRLTQAFAKSLAASAGFVDAGVVGLPYLEMAVDAERFGQFIESGYEGSMTYLARRNDRGELIRRDVRLPFPWARSVIVCLASYHADQPLSTDQTDAGNGWIARYGWSGKRSDDGSVKPADYHKTLLKRLQSLEEKLRKSIGDFQSKAYVDTGPVVERSVARAAGVGWTGKNTCLIHPKLGSWNFLAVLVTSLELLEASKPLIVPDRCGSCRRCLDACPTGALIEPYRMDATRCISYLTIEHPGEIAEELRTGMGRQVFGCDICQDVCPWNRKAPIQQAPDFEFRRTDSETSASAAGDYETVTREELVNPALEWLASMDFTEFELAFNGSPIRRAGFEGLLRNVAIAMGNSGLSRYVPWLESWASEVPKSDAVGVVMNEKSRANRLAWKEASRWALDRIKRVAEVE